VTEPERLTAGQWEARRREADEAEAGRHRLSVAELEAARRMGMSAGRYAAMRGVSSLEDFRAARARLEAGDGGRAA
jgi:hypothetical protein